jgi:hypothetical protein
MLFVFVVCYWIAPAARNRRWRSSGHGSLTVSINHCRYTPDQQFALARDQKQLFLLRNGDRKCK